MKFNNPYWGVKEKIQLLQRWILFHSILYYDLDKTIVSDFMYDKNAKQLLDLMNGNKEEASKSSYAEIFKNYDGNTGFDLVEKLKETNQKLYESILYDIRINKNFQNM